MPATDLGHTVGAVSRYDVEYLKYYLPEVHVEVNAFSKQLGYINACRMFLMFIMVCSDTLFYS